MYLDLLMLALILSFPLVLLIKTTSSGLWNTLRACLRVPTLSSKCMLLIRVLLNAALLFGEPSFVKHSCTASMSLVGICCGQTQKCLDRASKLVCSIMDAAMKLGSHRLAIMSRSTAEMSLNKISGVVVCDCIINNY
ncbi:unnamed protein product [Moneuplotes crassus]|uniref:Uncharacterized protein n=1 Tax=Euplotes crassus TaxID=5936 RepID=A0AAD1U055_EUPCR|nr:unnamed protein product [Moneuplotes crassus]